MSSLKHFAQVRVNLMGKLTFTVNDSVKFFFYIPVSFFVLLENFSVNMETSPLPVKSSNFGLYSALMVIDSWGSLACHYWDKGHPFYIYGHLRGPVALTPIVGTFTTHLLIT